MSASRRLGIAGLGAVGREVARRVAGGAAPGLTLTAAASRGPDRARTVLNDLGLADVQATDSEGLARSCDVILEAAPADRFPGIAAPALAAGRTLVVLSAGALLRHWDSFAARGDIVVPSGAVGGLDVIRAAGADGGIERLTLVSRKPVKSLLDAPYLATRRAELCALTEPLKVFSGDAAAAARALPANANIAAALALAAGGPQRVEVEIWADPAAAENRHHVELVAPAVRMSLDICSNPLPDNPRTSRLAVASVLAALTRLSERVSIGG